MDSVICVHLTVIPLVSDMIKRIAPVNQVAILENIRFFLQASINRVNILLSLCATELYTYQFNGIVVLTILTFV